MNITLEEGIEKLSFAGPLDVTNLRDFLIALHRLGLIELKQPEQAIYFEVSNSVGVNFVKVDETDAIEVMKQAGYVVTKP